MYYSDAQDTNQNYDGTAALLFTFFSKTFRYQK